MKKVETINSLIGTQRNVEKRDFFNLEFLLRSPKFLKAYDKFKALGGFEDGKRMIAQPKLDSIDFYDELPFNYHRAFDRLENPITRSRLLTL